jgi:hypothetical protein
LGEKTKKKHVAGGDVALIWVREGDLICVSKDRRQMDTVEAREKGGREGEWGRWKVGRKAGNRRTGRSGRDERGSQRERITKRR